MSSPQTITIKGDNARGYYTLFTPDYSIPTLVLCQDLVQHKMRNFNYFQLTNSDSLATLAL